MGECRGRALGALNGGKGEGRRSENRRASTATSKEKRMLEVARNLEPSVASLTSRDPNARDLAVGSAEHRPLALRLIGPPVDAEMVPAFCH